MAMTNLEKIQSMSVSELAEFLVYSSFDCNNCEVDKDHPCDQECYTHCLHWLERELKDNEHS